MQPGLAVGRGEELSRLEDVLSSVADSGLRLALVEGPRGVGKARLAGAFAARARGGGALVLEGRCASGVPFGPFASIVEQALAVLGRVGHRLPSQSDLSCSDGCHALWFHHRGPRRAAAPRGLEPTGLVERRCFHAAIEALLRSVGGLSPTVVMLHDLDSADVETVELLRHLLDAGSPRAGDSRARLMLVATLELGEGAPPPAAVDAIRRHHRAVRVHVGALDEAGLRAMLQSPEYLARILASTGGLPSAVERLLGADLPSADEYFVRRRAALGPEAGAVLEALCVLGRGAAPELLGAVAGVSDVASAVSELLASGLARVAAGEAAGVFLSDPDDGRRGGEGLSPERRTELHARSVEMLLARGDAPGALRHALSGGQLARALELAPGAADALAAVHAHAEAALLLNQLLDSLEADAPEALLARLADLLEASSELRAALVPARRLHQLDPSDAVAARRLARLHVLAGDLRAAARVIELSRDAARAAGAAADEAGLTASLAELLYQSGRLAEADDHARSVLEAAPRSTAGLEARQTLAKVALAEGRLSEAEEQYHLYERAAAELGDAKHEALAVGGRGVVCVTAGDLDEAEKLLRRCSSLAERAHDRKGQALAWHNLAVVAHLRHDYTSARTRYEEAIRLLQLVGNRPSLARVAYNLGELYETLGDPVRARSMCDFGDQVGGVDVAPRAQAEGLLLRGRIDLMEGQIRGARTAFEAARGILADVDPLRGAAATVGLARAAMLGDEPQLAAELLGSLPEGLSASRLADAAVASAELAHAEDPRGRDPTVAWREALEAAAGSRDGALELRALVGLAEALSDVGDVLGSAALIERAAELDSRMAARVPQDLSGGWDDRPIRRRLLSASRGAAHRKGAGGRADEPLTRARLGFVGRSRALSRILSLVERVGPSDCNVLVRGESGTGKELVARALHATSSRAEGPLVCVNCAAIVDNLLLSELFGHERGAFTGAHERKLGRFEVADGGTLFLDEIGDISPAVQAALLRVLQERRFERVGGHRSISVDVRVVAATNRDLESMVRAGTFREDLYYRLKQVSLEVPPLRDRPEDVPALALYFLAQVAGERGEAPKRLSRDALTLLLSHRWPGNVRQLDNVIRAATLFADGSTVEAADLQVEGHAALAQQRTPTARAIAEAVQDAGWAGTPTSEGEALYARLRRADMSLKDLKKDVERQCIARALDESGGTISKAAALLGMKRPRLSQLVKEYGLRESDED